MRPTLRMSNGTSPLIRLPAPSPRERGEGDSRRRSTLSPSRASGEAEACPLIPVRNGEKVAAAE